MIDNLDKLDEQLIEAWQSGKPVMTVAADIGLEPKTVESAWRRLKRDGRLPQRDRPLRQGPNSGPRREPDNGHDGRPRDNGGMLEALWREHPEYAPK